MKKTDAYSRLSLAEGDITKQKVDAIVNAANQQLLGGGGVDGAIHRVAGPELLAECRTLGGCPTGSARITKGYKLPAKYVIHTVGPVYGGGGESVAELLASCYSTSLELAADHECKSVAFPAVSCGVYGYPPDEAAGIAIETTADFLSTSELPQRVIFVLFGRQAYKAFEKVFNSMRHS